MNFQRLKEVMLLQKQKQQKSEEDLAAEIAEKSEEE